MWGPSKIFSSLVFVVSVAACGGASDSPPKPLERHFDEMYIAAVPLDQKQTIVSTGNDYQVARMENAKAEADYTEVTNTQIQIARNDQKQAQLAVDSAISQKQSAEKSADTNRINQSAIALHNAEDLKRATDARVKYLEAYRDYMKRFWRYTQENMYWREAQYEQAKAAIAKGNGIAPKGVQYDSFPKQVDDRGRRVQSAKEKVLGDKEHAVQAREAWLKIQETADRENGHTTTAWDPMAPKGGAAAQTSGMPGSTSAGDQPKP